jgi:hypothetical protein
MPNPLRQPLVRLPSADRFACFPSTNPAVGAGNSEGGLDFANMLKPALARGQLQCIGATTLDEYRQHIEPDPALSRRFQVRDNVCVWVRVCVCVRACVRLRVCMCVHM